MQDKTDSTAENNDRPAPPVWRPEDAANFLGAAIKEAQRPLADSIKRQGIPHWAFVLAVVLTTTIAAFGFYQFGVQMNNNREMAQSTIIANKQMAGEKITELQSSLEKTRCTVEKNKNEAEKMNAARLQAEKESIRIAGELKAKDSQLADALRKTEESEKKLSELSITFETEKTRLSNAIALLKKANEDLMLRNIKSVGGEKQLQSRLEEQTKAIRNDARSRIAELERKLAESKEREKLLTSQAEGLQQENDGLRKQLESARKILRSLRNSASEALDEGKKQTEE